ncbi:MAG: hypothetical protein K2X93_08735 [Candidatus Obscuribacterales bacterium]|nr:hypothetical protein [Candidatus Obscuribacterales bacterium]
MLVTKDGKTETIKPLVDAKFKPSGLRCGDGTYTFPDGTEVFFKNGMVFSLAVKGKGTTVEGNYHLSDYGKSPVVKVTRAK